MGLYDQFRLTTVTPVLDTAAYTAGDVLFGITLVANALPDKDRSGVLESVMVIDKSDQATAIAFDLYVLGANVPFGTINNAPSISDTDALQILGVVPIATADYKDIGGAKVAFKEDLGILVKPASGTTNLYIAGVNGAGTPTVAASDLVLRLGIH